MAEKASPIIAEDKDDKDDVIIVGDKDDKGDVWSDDDLFSTKSSPEKGKLF